MAEDCEMDQGEGSGVGQDVHLGGCWEVDWNVEQVVDQAEGREALQVVAQRNGGKMEQVARGDVNPTAVDRMNVVDGEFR